MKTREERYFNIVESIKRDIDLSFMEIICLVVLLSGLSDKKLRDIERIIILKDFGDGYEFHDVIDFIGRNK